MSKKKSLRRNSKRMPSRSTITTTVGMGEIGIDVLAANFGKYRRECREET